MKPFLLALPLLSLLLVFALGCGDEGPGTVDASTDTGPVAVPDAATDAGDGVCCPRDSSPCSNPRIGGRAATLAECPGPSGFFDGWWSDGNAGGCPIWVNHGITPTPGAMCCGCPPPDAGR